MNRPNPLGPRRVRRALDKAIRCLRRGTQIPAGVRGKILPLGRLEFVASRRGQLVEFDGRSRRLGFGEFLARFGPLAA